MREGFWGEVAAIAATIALARQEVPLAIEQCHHTLKHLSTDNFYVRGLLFVLLGQAYRVSGDLGAASQALAEVYTTSHVAGNVFLTVGAMVNLAEIYKMRDQLHQAARTWRQVIDLANTPDGRPLPFAGPAYIGMGKLLREWNDLQAATEYLTKGSELCQQGGIEGNVFNAFITLAFVWQALGDTKRAFEFLQQGEWMFWDLRQPEKALTIHLVDERFVKLVVEVENPEAEAFVIQEAIRAYTNA
jgi:LuxR family transcriptional regulator, maltose regulon positive regulatory protein